MTSEADTRPAMTRPLLRRRPQRAQSLTAEAVTINAPAQELYAFWRNPVNLLQVMDNITAIVPIDEKRSRWTVKAPAGNEVSWESVIAEDIPGESITWHSAPGADVTNNGRIEFRETPNREL